MKELHESRHCPQCWRDGVTNFLAFFAIYSDVYRQSVPLVDELLRKSGEDTIVDLCAGNGLYMLRFLSLLSGLAPGRNVQAVLTDRHPNKGSSLEMAKLENGRIKYFPEPTDAADALRKLQGLHVMFSALHHFDEEELTTLLKTAAAERRPFAFFDYSRRNLSADLLPLLLVPGLIFLTAPLIRPFSWRQLFFIYVIPVIPVLVMVDGFISRLRSYNCPELHCIIEKIGDIPGYDLRAGKFSSILNLCTVHFIAGSQK